MVIYSSYRVDSVKKFTPRITFSFRSCTKIKDFLMHIPWLKICALDNLYSILSLLLLAPKMTCLVFSWNLVGIKPSWMQFKDALKSIKVMVLRINLSLITMAKETSYFWKITLFVVFKYESSLFHGLLRILRSLLEFLGCLKSYWSSLGGMLNLSLWTVLIPRPSFCIVLFILEDPYWLLL